MAGAYLNFAKKGLSDAVRGASAIAQTLADEGSTLLAGSKVLRDYKLSATASSGPVATSGPGDIWKIYDAVSTKPHGEKKVARCLLRRTHACVLCHAHMRTHHACCGKTCAHTPCMRRHTIRIPQ